MRIPVSRARLAGLRVPRHLTQRLRARLRAQRQRWRAQRRKRDGALFPAAGEGMVAVRDLTSARTGPRVLVLHATAGAGHQRAAQALAGALAAIDSTAVVREVDTLVFASRLYRHTYAASYNAMASRAPALWGALYRSWQLAPVNRSTAPVRLAIDRMNLRRLVRVLERERADVIVCTHFLPVEALSPRRRLLQVPLHCVITDFTAHPFWAFPYVDRYFVASEPVKEELSGQGVPAERIQVTGIPIDPRFAGSPGKETARAHFGLDPKGPLVVVMGGGRGVGPLAELAERLASLQSRPQVVVVCGTNQRLKETVAALAAASSGQIRALGFTWEVDLLLEACDVVVGKAGGLTCAEALAKRAPLVVFRPTPGQEVANARYLEQGGAARHADSIESVAAAVHDWLSDATARRRAREAASRLAAPRAAETIAREVLRAARDHRDALAQFQKLA